jgi:omega-amidase
LQGAAGLGQNVALAVDRNGHDLACYSKSHLFSFLDEDQHHESGNGPKPFTFAGVNGACFICYDLRFPELFRLVADECHIVCLIASWPQERQMHFDALLRARAVENQYYVLGLNRVGVGGGLRFVGNSAIYDPFGNLIDRAEGQPKLLMADIDPAQVKELRGQMPFLKDRRF